MKTALVIGASGGIGAETARRLFKDGYRVAITYNSNRRAASKLAKELGGCPCFHCDVKDPYELETLFDTFMGLFGRIDVLVNCAGVAHSSLLQEMKPEDISDVIDTDLTGTIYAVRNAAKHMVPRKSGCIISIASIWGVRGASCEAVYSAAKGGIIAFTKAMAKELAPSGIRVNCISPGVIRTHMLDGYTEEEIGVLEDDTPLSRLGNASDVAGAVSFLAGEDASFITGQNFVVDGGFIL